MRSQWLVALSVAGAFVAGTAASHVARADSDLAYFQQFLYKKETHDDGDGEVQVQYRQLLADEEIPIDANQVLVAHFELYLMEDMSSHLRYSEMYKVRNDEHSEWRYEIHDFCPTNLKGPWAVPAQQLVIGDAVTGERATWHSQNAVKLTFRQALKNPVLAGKSIVLSYGYSNADKDAGQPQFCH